jgi:hypothetical protein
LANHIRGHYYQPGQLVNDTKKTDFEPCFIFRARFVALKGEQTKVGVFYEVVRLLTKDFDECIEQDFDHCMFSTWERNMLQQIGCTVPWIPNKENICTDKNLTIQAYTWHKFNYQNQKGICPKGSVCSLILFIDTDILRYFRAIQHYRYSPNASSTTLRVFTENFKKKSKHKISKHKRIFFLN